MNERFSNQIKDMKFILSRTNDYEHHSRKWILGYGILFWLATRLLAVVMILTCTAIYNKFGINPEQLTKFGGEPTNVKSIFSACYGVMMLLLIAPVLEECIFRLGLSFKKWQIAIALAAIPAYILFQRLGRISLSAILIFTAVAIALFCIVYFTTSQKFWDRMKLRYFKSAIWTTSILFGLTHLVAFSHLTIELLPYMLCVIAVPFFAGCAIAYYRVNLGFWWAVGLHIFNNLPAIAMIATL